MLPVQAQASGTKTSPEVPGLLDNVWEQSKLAAHPVFPRLTQSISTDVLVVGAGIAGLSVAYHLAKAGKQVVLVEAGTIGRGQTGRSTAQLRAWLDDTYHAIEEEFSPDFARLAADAQRYAIDAVKQISDQEGIDSNFEYVPGYLFPHDEMPQSKQVLDRELKAAQKAGLPGVEIVDLGGSSEVGGIRTALQFDRCANFDPLKYVQGLAQAVSKAGGSVYEMSSVTPPDGRTVKTPDGHSITANSIVLATNAPLHRNLAIHSRQSAVRTYVDGLQVPEGSVKNAQFWDTGEPYNYVRLVKGKTAGQDILLAGGANHLTGIEPQEIGKPWKQLEQWARRRFPQAQNCVYQWGGQIYEPIDKLPLYGQDPLNALQSEGTHYVATGDSGQGTTGGTIAGKLIADQILGIPNAWTKVFAPARAPSATVKTAAAEAEVLYDVTLGIARNVLPIGATGRSISQIAPGTGGIISQGDKQIAAYVDADGTQHKLTAVCPHLGCVVQWNPVDQTFNCPCHGAGWTKHGQLIQGPAKSDLAKL